jgi:hypothetical protein
LTPFDRAWFQRLNVTYDEALSDFVFNCNLRRYTVEAIRLVIRAGADTGFRADKRAGDAAGHTALSWASAGQCWLTVSKPVLKAPMI